MQPPSPINDPIKPLLSPIIVLAWSREAAVGEQPEQCTCHHHQPHSDTEPALLHHTATVRILQMMHIDVIILLEEQISLLR